MTWPGQANLEIAIVWLWKGNWKGPRILGDTVVSEITPALKTPGEVSGKPKPLTANIGLVIEGPKVLGMVFCSNLKRQPI